MQPYTKSAAVINLGSAPMVPHLGWSLDARLAMSHRQCAAPVPAAVMEERRARFLARGSKRKPSQHPGRGRRHRLEVRTRQLLDIVAGRPGAYVGELAGDLHGHSIHELLHAPIPNAPRWALALRMQGRALLDLVVRHGPASGWGIPQPTVGPERASRWTPYYVPKKSERCWRWWRLAALFLVRVLTTLARAWWKLVPLHREAPGGTTAGKRGEVLLASQLVEPTGCRDQTPVSLRALLDRLGSRFAM